MFPLNMPPIMRGGPGPGRLNTLQLEAGQRLAETPRVTRQMYRQHQRLQAKGRSAFHNRVPK
jgi:hypothetical protein